MAGTVLAHIAASNPQKENLATEALAFILNQSIAARTAFRRRVSAADGPVPQLARVITQVATGAESRPDLLMLGDEGQVVGYIEAKFWASLTEAQPVEYVRRLTDAKGGVLVFVAPERRLPTLRVEILDRLQSAGMSPVVSSGAAGSSLSVGQVRLQVLSWTAVLSSLRDAVSDDREAASDVHQLRGLVERFETAGFVPLTRDDIDDLGVPLRLVSLTTLAWEIVDAACEAGVLSTSGLRVTARDFGGGRYAKFKSAGCWIGLDHEMWSLRGRSPIWIDFADNEWGRAEELRGAFRGWINSDPPRAYSEEGGIHVPLLLTIGAEKDRVTADAVRQLRDLETVVNGASLPTR